MNETEKLLEEIKPYLEQIAYNVRWYEPLHLHDTAVQILKACKEYLVFRDGSELELDQQA